MIFVVLGAALLLIPVVLLAFVTGPTLATEEFREKGFGGRWNYRETLAFFLLLMGAATRGVLFLAPFVAGFLLLAYGVASLENASLLSTFLFEGIAFVSSLLLWLVYRRWRGRPMTFPPSVITHALAPPALLFNTPYTLNKLIVTIHSVRRRQSFRPIVHSLAASGQVQPVTWFLEITCTLENRSRKEARVWAHLNEIVSENRGSQKPLYLRQFLPLTEDEAGDRDLGSNSVLSSAHYHLVVKDKEECKIFFKFNEHMQVHTMAFSLHLSRKNQASSQKLLFTVDV